MINTSVVTAMSMDPVMIVLFQVLNTFLVVVFVVFVFKLFKLMAKINKALDMWLKKNNE